jgi:hypothetical protein
VIGEACDDRRGDLAAEALRRLEGPARDDLVAHVASCEACRTELARLRSVAEVLPLADPDAVGTTAPPALESRVLERVAAAQQAARGQRRNFAFVGIAAAAALVVGVIVGSLVSLGSDGDARQLDGIEVAFREEPPGVDASATIAGDDDGTVVELDASGLDPDLVFALWLSSGDGERVPAGTFRPDSDGTVEARLPCSLRFRDAARIWVTTPEGEVPLDAWFR